MGRETSLGRVFKVSVLTLKSLFPPRWSSGFVVVEWIVHVDHAIQSVRDSLPMCQSSSCKLIFLQYDMQGIPSILSPA